MVNDNIKRKGNLMSKQTNLPTAVVAHAWFHTKNAEEVIEKQASFKFVKGIRSKPIVKIKKVIDMIIMLGLCKIKNGEMVQNF